MKIVHVVSSIAESSGGPSRSVPQLCEALGKIGVEIKLCTVDLGPRFGPIVEIDQSLAPTHMAKSWNWKTARLSFPRGFKKLAASHIRDAQLVHCHGLWSTPVHQAVVEAKKAGRPYIITPRGMLEPWSLQRSKLKKRLVMALYQRRDLNDAVCLHATAPMEAISVRQAGFGNPTAIIPNALDVEKFSVNPEHGAMALEKFPQLQGRRISLFLSRIHPKKGLLNLAEVWGKLSREFPDWSVVIAGPDENGHQREVQDALEQHKCADSVHFIGSVDGELKSSLYAASDLFVLPTFSENFGIVVAEALASGCPVITTTGTPWSELQDRDCGWYIDTGVEPLLESWGQAMGLTPGQRMEMGGRGRKLVEERYSWAGAARQMKAVYDWILNGTDMPDCVRLD